MFSQMLSLRHIMVIVTLILFFDEIRASGLVEPKCPDLPKLDVVPGFGWDALTNSDMSQSLKITYDQCKVSMDGKYLIPDNTHAVVVKTKQQQLSAEIIEHWNNYTSVTARGFKFGSGLGWENYIALNLHFSDDFQKFKNLQVKHGAFTVRTQLQNVLYSVYAAPDAALSDDLRQQFIKVMIYIIRNRTDNAEYLLQMIVSNYGTHYTRSVSAGAVFIKEDFLQKSFLHHHMHEKQKIVSSAKLSVLFFGLNVENRQEDDNLIDEEYKKSLIVQSTRAMGGPNYDDTISVDQWLSRTSENMVAIDRSGDLITSFISPSKFPKAPLWLLKKTNVMLTKTIQDYYTFNSRKGCTKVNSPNFDYTANVDDGSCEVVPHNHSFGGVYQVCHQPRNLDRANICPSFDRKNILTGSFSCPMHFETTKLYSQTKSYDFTRNNPWRQCSGMWWWKRCWYNDSWEWHKDYVTIDTYQCMADANPEMSQTNYQFGGVYSSMVININTRKHECPKLFRPISIFGDGLLTVCVRNNIDSTNPNILSFGGLTSCKMGLQCPTGYHGHLAQVYEGCQINYCIQEMNIGYEGKMPLLVRPPFINVTEEILSEDGNNEYDYEEYEYEKVTPQLQESTSNENNGSSALGIALPLFFLILVLALLGLAYRKRSYIITHVQRYRGSNPAYPNRGIEMPAVSDSVANSNAKPLLKKANHETNLNLLSVAGKLLR